MKHSLIVNCLGFGWLNFNFYGFFNICRISLLNYNLFLLLIGLDHATCHLDMILGHGWDVRQITDDQGSAHGYRVIITLEIIIDMRQQLRLNTHAITCRGGHVDMTLYRHACVSMSQSLHMSHIGPDIMESIHSVRGVSLDWEEFQVC